MTRKCMVKRMRILLQHTNEGIVKKGQSVLKKKKRRRQVEVPRISTTRRGSGVQDGFSDRQTTDGMSAEWTERRVR